jgi:FkbM family methyltransferase
MASEVIPPRHIIVDDAHFKYLALQKGSLSHLVSDRVAWHREYERKLTADFNSIERWLPIACLSVLDIGSGLGGIDIMINRHYGCVKVELLDGEDDPPVMKLHRQTFNNMAVARDFLSKNGVDNVTSFDANDPVKWVDLGKVDLVISLGSWCFHYPPEQYMSFVLSKCHTATVVIVDVRKEKPSYFDQLFHNFEMIGMACEMQKASRITYREDFGCWWPDYDHKPEACYQYVLKRLPDSDYATKLCKKRNVCVQAGGHVGLWPKRLAKSFKTVYTFECEPALFECMQRNLADIPNIVMSNQGLGAEAGKAKMLPHVSAGSWRIDPTGTLGVDLTTIDALQLSECDALFLDVESYEVEVMKGAANTITKFSPVIHIEELPRSKTAIRAHLRSLKYRCVQQIHGDFVYIR